MPERREFRPRARRSGFRDANLIIIATEGTHTERKYFEDMISHEHFRNSRVHIEVLKGENNSSSEHVLRRLNQFRRTYRLNVHDELWLVVDRDRWTEASLGDVCAQCLKANYAIAVSNPCFELWLLLHVRALDGYPPEILDEFRRNQKVGGRNRLAAELVNVLGSYNASNPDTSQFIPQIDAAIQRARKLDINPEHRWPNDLGSRVYRLVEKILDSKT